MRPAGVLGEVAAEGPSGNTHVAMAPAIGLAALGGGLGQGRAAAAALEGIARNPSSRKDVFTPMILGLAFVESLVIFALIVVFSM